MTAGKRELVREWTLRLCALFLGAVLVSSAMFHSENNYAFLSAIYSYRLVGANIGIIAAAILPYFQMTLGLILLFFPKTWMTAFTWSALLFLVYVAAQSTAYARGLNIACGCFSASDDNPIGLISISTVALCACAAVVGIILSARYRNSAQP